MSEWRSDPTGFNESVIGEFRANGGVVGGELAGMPLLLLTTIDTRSGQPRTTPLAYHRRGGRYLVIASKGMFQAKAGRAIPVIELEPLRGRPRFG